MASKDLFSHRLLSIPEIGRPLLYLAGSSPELSFEDDVASGRKSPTGSPRDRLSVEARRSSLSAGYPEVAASSNYIDVISLYVYIQNFLSYYYLVFDNTASTSRENSVNAIGFGEHRSESQGKARRQ